MEGRVVHGGGGAPGRLLVVHVRGGGDHGGVHCRGNNDVPVLPDLDVSTSASPGPTSCPGLFICLAVYLFARTFI